MGDSVVGKVLDFDDFWPMAIYGRSFLPSGFPPGSDEVSVSVLYNNTSSTPFPPPTLILQGPDGITYQSNPGYANNLPIPRTGVGTELGEFAIPEGTWHIGKGWKLFVETNDFTIEVLPSLQQTKQTEETNQSYVTAPPPLPGSKTYKEMIHLGDWEWAGHFEARVNWFSPLRWHIANLPPPPPGDEYIVLDYTLRSLTISEYLSKYGNLDGFAQVPPIPGLSSPNGTTYPEDLEATQVYNAEVTPRVNPPTHIEALIPVPVKAWNNDWRWSGDLNFQDTDYGWPRP